MRVRNSQTGKYEHLSIGQAVCGKRFSEITFTAADSKNMFDSKLSTTRTMEWIQHLLTVRLDRKTK